MTDGKHVHEHTELSIDSDAVAANEDSPLEEKLEAVIAALADEDVEVTIETETEEVN